MIISTTATNLLILLINFVTSILAARLLGADGRGQLALVLLYPQMIATMGFLGLDRGLAITGGQKRLSCPAASIVALTAVLTIPVMLISYFVITAEVTDPSLEKLSLQYVFYVPALYVFMFSGALFNGLGMFFEYNISRLSFYGSYLLLILVFWVSDMPSLSGFVYASLLSVYVVMLVSIVFYMKSRSRGRIEEQSLMPENLVKDIGVIFKKASFFIVPGILLVASTKLDQIIVSNYLELKYLGLFVVYMAYSQLLAPVSNAISVNVFHLGIKNSMSNIGQLTRLTVFIYMLGSILLALLAPFLIRLLYGATYLEHVGTARLLVFSAFLFLCSKIINEFMMGKSMVRQDVIASVIFMAALFSFAYVLIPVFSIFGVAIAMAAANTFRSLYLIMVFHRSSGIGVSELLFVKMSDFRWALLSARRTFKARI